MKKNTKIIFIATTIFIISVFTVLPVLAQSTLSITDKLDLIGPSAGYASEPNLAQNIGEVIKIFLSILGIVFMVYIIYGGYQWIMARGVEEQLTKAKAIIRGSIIGLIIVLASYAISSFIVDRMAKATDYNQTSEVSWPDGGILDE